MGNESGKQKIPASRIVLLVVLLLVLAIVVGYRVRAASDGGSSPAVAQAAPHPGFPVLSVPPDQMRATVAAEYRLTPDRRFLWAVADIHQFLTGTPAELPTAVFADGQWAIRYRGQQVGTLPELAGFAEWQALLDAWAGRLVTQYPVSLAGPASDNTAIGEELQAFDATLALRAIGQLDRRWQNGRGTLADLPVVARALSIVCLQRLDDIGMDDSLDGRALAYLTLTGKLVPGAAVLREQVLMAGVLGYMVHARELAQELPADDAVRLYATHADTELEALAAGGRGTAEQRYLYLLRLSEEGSADAMLKWYRSYYAGQAGLPVLRAVLQAGDFEVTRTLAPSLPYITVASVGREAAYYEQDPADSPFERTALNLFRTVAERLEVGEAKGHQSQLKLFEYRLAKIGAQIGGRFLDAKEAENFYRACYYSALYREGLHEMNSLSSVEGTRQFADWLDPGMPGLPADFARWYGDLAQAKQGKADKEALLADLAGLKSLGSSPLEHTFETLRSTMELAHPLIQQAARELAGRLDDRPANRTLLGGIAYATLFDLPLAERLYANVADIQGEPAQLLWQAHYNQEKDKLVALAEDQRLPLDSRIRIPRYLWQMGVPDAEVDAVYRRLVDGSSAEWDVLERYTGFLERVGRYPQARELLRGWLDRHHPDERNPFPYIQATAALARMYYREQRYREGYQVIEPVLDSYTAGVLTRGARLLDKVGNADGAEDLARRAVDRYPDSAWALGTLMEIYWNHGKYEAAAKSLRAVPYRFDDWAWRKNIGGGLLRVAREDPAKAGAAFAAMHAGGVNLSNLEDAIVPLELDGMNDMAFRMQSDLHAQGLFDVYLATHAYGYLRKTVPEAQAVDWLRQRIPPGIWPAASMIFYDSESADDLLWDFLEDPEKIADSSGEASDSDSIWLYRAATYVKEGRPADERGKRLLEHYASATTRPSAFSYYHDIGRYLMGYIGEQEIVALITNDKRRCEIPYYLGLLAASEGRFEDATAWFRVSIETGRYNEGEYRWAYTELSGWSSQGKNLRLFTKDDIWKGRDVKHLTNADEFTDDCDCW